MILYVAAMDIEVHEIILKYPFEHISHQPKLYKLNDPSKDIGLLITGIGKVNAAYALTEILNRYDVDAIYNLGFAGATKAYNQKDIVLVLEAAYHDFDLTVFGYEKGQVPGLPETFSSQLELQKAIQTKLNLPTAKLLTGDVFMTEDNEQPWVVDMEGAALYHVAYLKKIPIVSLKVISDIMGANKHIESYKAFEATQGALLLKKVFDALI